MKRFFYSAFIIMAGVLVFGSCSDDEGAITPSGNYSPIRGEFPQGDSEYDDVIKEISEKYGVYLLYKDITEQDLNRTWVSTGTGPLIVAGAEEDRAAGAWNLPDEQLPFYVNYFSNHIFPNISEEFAQSAFPVKIYMINNLREEPRDFGEDDNEENENEESSEDTSTGTGGNNNITVYIGDFDSWAVSFTDEMMHGSNPEYSLKQLRCILIIELIKNAIEKGEIESPDEFWEGFDFGANTKLELNNPYKSNYKYKMGFVEMINDNFGTGYNKQVWVDYYFTSTYYWEKGKYPAYNLFTTYIKNAIWLTPEEFAAKYNPQKYPMITEKYNIVVNHMKEVYGIDLVGIANGPKEE